MDLFSPRRPYGTTRRGLGVPHKGRGFPGGFPRADHLLSLSVPRESRRVVVAFDHTTQSGRTSSLQSGRVLGVFGENLLLLRGLVVVDHI